MAIVRRQARRSRIVPDGFLPGFGLFSEIGTSLTAVLPFRSSSLEPSFRDHGGLEARRSRSCCPSWPAARTTALLEKVTGLTFVIAASGCDVSPIGPWLSTLSHLSDGTRMRRANPRRKRWKPDVDATRTRRASDARTSQEAETRFRKNFSVRCHPASRRFFSRRRTAGVPWNRSAPGVPGRRGRGSAGRTLRSRGVRKTPSARR